MLNLLLTNERTEPIINSVHHLQRPHTQMPYRAMVHEVYPTAWYSIILNDGCLNHQHHNL